MCRPFDPKQALHVVLRSSKARGEHSLLHPRHCKAIHELVDRLKTRWNIRVYRYANVGNHLHLLVRAKRRSDWQGFVRQLSGAIAMRVTGARKGNAYTGPAANANSSAGRAFWDHLVYTRIVRWGRDFNGTAAYILKNIWQSCGIPIQKLQELGLRLFATGELDPVPIKTRRRARA